MDNNRTRKMQDQTHGLLKKISGNKISEADIDALREVLWFHEHRYYVMDDPLVSDAEYDSLFTALRKIEEKNPDLVTPDSPTQRVAPGLTKDFPATAHLVPMLSLDNSYDEKDLLDFDRRVRELTGLNKIAYCVEPKFDGASISLVYENNRLLRGVTRGDGVMGEEITNNIRQVRSIPLSANFSEYGISQVEIRGEVMINKNNFRLYNEAIMEQGLPPLANPRNAASGSLRIKDPSEVRRRNLEAFVYSISHVVQDNQKASRYLAHHKASMELLWDLGFRCPVKQMKIFDGIEDVIRYCQEFESQRDELPYEIDGMVIKVDEVALQEVLGMTSHHPRWAIAFKFKARQATSELVAVEFQVGRTGSITPVAKIKPTPLGGVTISSISLFNEDVIREKDLMIGDQVLVERAGDVIPYIVKPLAELRKGKEKPVKFPKNCPACNDELVKPEGEAVWRCTNINCPAQVVERLIHFVSKDAMDIRGFGEANIRKFYQMELLKTIPGIYTFDFSKLSGLPGFGEKSIENLQTAIERSRKQPLHRLIFALGIRYVGETTAKTLARAVKHILDFKRFTVDDLLALEDVGPKVAGSIVQFFGNNDNIRMLEELEDLGLQLSHSESEKQEGGLLEGLNFLFTGTLPTMKRSEAEALVEEHGGKVLGSVSSKLNYLVAGEEAGSKLEKAKKISSIRIISEKDFLKLIGQA